MQAPIDAPTPAEGELIAWTISNWASGGYGMWYVINDKRKIVTSGDIFKCATLVNRHNKKVRDGKSN